MEISIRMDAQAARWARRAALLGVPLVAMAMTNAAVGVPHEFAPQTKISAAQMNQNFTDVEDQIAAVDAKVATKADATEVPTITAWQVYTVNIDNGGGTLGVASGVYRRVGDSVELRVALNGGVAGAAGSSALQFSLPQGLAVDTAKLPNSVTVIVGAGDIGFTNTGMLANALYNTAAPNKVRLLINGTGGGTTYYVTGSNPFNAASAGFSASFSATLPITGWSVAN